VILWSVGNEVGEQNTGEAGASITRRLVGIAHEEDPTRPATASMNSAKPNSAFAAAMDVIALNYQGEGIRDGPAFDNFRGLRTPPQYLAFREEFPSKTILSSEAAAAYSSRGVYLFPVTQEMSSPARDGSGGDSKRGR
jgi:beta-galactosidase